MPAVLNNTISAVKQFIGSKKQISYNESSLRTTYSTDFGPKCIPKQVGSTSSKTSIGNTPTRIFPTKAERRGCGLKN